MMRTIFITTVITVLGAYYLTHEVISACLLGMTFSFLAIGAAHDLRTFSLPMVTVLGALMSSVTLAVLRPETTNPSAIHSNTIVVILNHFGGGAVMFVGLLAIKRIGEYFLRVTREGRTRFEINSEGVTIAGERGHEHVSWEDFCFTKIIPQRDIRCLRNGSEEPLAAGEIEILDGGVRLRGRDLDLGTAPVTVHSTGFVAWRNAMGLGDVMLAPTLGILLGLNIGLFEMVLLASLTGTVHGFYLKRKDRRLPFGPHLTMATAYVILSRYHLAPSLAKWIGFPV